MSVDVEIVGSAELQGRMMNLLNMFPDKIVRPALTAALRPIVKAAREYVPVETGILRGAIASKVGHRKGTGFIWGGVGVRRGIRIPVMRRHYEAGTVAYSKTGRATYSRARYAWKWKGSWATGKAAAKLIGGTMVSAVPSRYAHLIHNPTKRRARHWPFLLSAMQREKANAFAILQRQIFERTEQGVWIK